MSQMLDCLPYTDPVDETYTSWLSSEIDTEFSKLDKQELHPRIHELVGENLPLRYDAKLYEEYCEQTTRASEENKSRSLKRTIEDDILRKSKQHCSGVDIDRYNLSRIGDDDQLLGITMSYLKHQELVLGELVGKSIRNQWLINNDYVETSNDNIETQSQVQHTQINELNRYRKSLQEREQLTFAYLEQQWRDELARNIEKGLAR